MCVSLSISDKIIISNPLAIKWPCISLFILVTFKAICNHHETVHKDCSFSNKTSLSLVFRISPISNLFSFLWVNGFFMSLNTFRNILINDLVLEIKPKGIYITFISWKMNNDILGKWNRYLLFWVYNWICTTFIIIRVKIPKASCALSISNAKAIKRKETPWDNHHNVILHYQSLND